MRREEPQQECNAPLAMAPRVELSGPPPQSVSPEGRRPPQGEGEETVSEELLAQAPEQYLCSITRNLMSDPVATADGHTYERIAIEKWLVRNETSPMTGLVLPHKTLMPIFALKSLIDDFKAKGGL